MLGGVLRDCDSRFLVVLGWLAAVAGLSCFLLTPLEEPFLSFRPAQVGLAGLGGIHVGNCRVREHSKALRMFHFLLLHPSACGVLVN